MSLDDLFDDKIIISDTIIYNYIKNNENLTIDDIIDSYYIIYDLLGMNSEKHKQTIKNQILEDIEILKNKKVIIVQNKTIKLTGNVYKFDLPKNKQYKITKFGEICNKNLVNPVAANLIFEDIKNSGDIEAKIESYKLFLSEIRLYGISNDLFYEGSYETSTEDYKKLKNYEEH